MPTCRLLRVVAPGISAVLGCASVLCANVASARDLYVATGGDDTSAGSLAAPWRTLARAASQAAAGDTVHIRAGTYAERLIPQNSGTAAAPIVFTAYSGELVTLNGTGLGGQGVVYLSGVQHVRVSGIEVTNAPEAGIWIIDSSYVTVSNNRTYNTVSSGIIVSEFGTNDHITIDGNDVELCCNDGPQECISISKCDVFAVTHNEVHDGGPGTNGGEGIDTKFGSANGVVAHNHVHHLTRQGLYADAWSVETHDIEFYGNVVHDCAFGIGVASEQGGQLTNIGFHDNLVYDTAGPGMYILMSAGPIRSASFVNNTVHHTGYDWGSGMWFNGADAQGLVVRNTIFSGLTGEPFFVQVAPAAWTLDHNLSGNPQSGNVPGFILGTPGYVDATAKNFHLAAGSPAIEAGSATTVFPTANGDVEGAPRIQDGDCDGQPIIDLGAYEYDGSCPGSGAAGAGGATGSGGTPGSGGTDPAAGAGGAASAGRAGAGGGGAPAAGGACCRAGAGGTGGERTGTGHQAMPPSGCGCRLPGDRDRDSRLAALVMGLLVMGSSRWRRRGGRAPR